MATTPKLTKAARKQLLSHAPYHQGGHSEEGARIARLIGVPFPLRMPALETQAVEEGFDPAELWPWYAEDKRKQAGAGSFPSRVKLDADTVHLTGDGEALAKIKEAAHG